MVGRKLFFDDIPEENGIVVHYDRNKTLPFAVEHIVTISDVPEGEVRMKCASITSPCVITSLKGTVLLELDNVKEQRVFQLRRKSDGVFIPRMTWIRLSSFSPDAIIMIMGDKNLARCPWISDYGEFVEQKTAQMRRKPRPARNFVAEKEAAERLAEEEKETAQQTDKTMQNGAAAKADTNADNLETIDVYGKKVAVSDIPAVDLYAMQERPEPKESDREKTGGENV